MRLIIHRLFNIYTLNQLACAWLIFVFLLFIETIVWVKAAHFLLVFRIFWFPVRKLALLRLLSSAASELTWKLRWNPRPALGSPEQPRPRRSKRGGESLGSGHTVLLTHRFHSVSRRCFRKTPYLWDHILFSFSPVLLLGCCVTFCLLRWEWQKSLWVTSSGVVAVHWAWHILGANECGLQGLQGKHSQSLASRFILYAERPHKCLTQPAPFLSLPSVIRFWCYLAWCLYHVCWCIPLTSSFMRQITIFQVAGGSQLYCNPVASLQPPGICTFALFWPTCPSCPLNSLSHLLSWPFLLFVLWISQVELCQLGRWCPEVLASTFFRCQVLLRLHTFLELWG